MSEEHLSREEKIFLLRLARETITHYVKTSQQPKPLPDTGLSETLRSPRGAFVTLHKAGQLRGCIGTFEGRGRLVDTIQAMAVSAGFEDPRFPPLSERELPRVDLEISVLSPLRQINDVNEIEVGTHGIYITKGFHRGVLLPQVATEYGWDRRTFLEHTCLKAGLPLNAWREGAKIEIFSADVFGEKDFVDKHEGGGL